MKQVKVSVKEEDLTILKDMARDEETSVSALIRKAVKSMLKQAKN
jgi:hypothetical protein